MQWYQIKPACLTEGTQLRVKLRLFYLNYDPNDSKMFRGDSCSDARTLKEPLLKTMVLNEYASQLNDNKSLSLQHDSFHSTVNLISSSETL